MRATRLPLLAAGLALGLSGAAFAQDATATLMDGEGETVGTASLTNTPAGVLIEVEFTALPEGTHAFHIHSVGSCEPDFGAAQGHLGGDAASHGYLAEDGPHAGDLPNIHVPESGMLRLDVLAPLAKLRDADGESAVEKIEDTAQALVGAPARVSILDEDGAALMVHEGPDDYMTDPAGAAGPRIACGAIHAL